MRTNMFSKIETDASYYDEVDRATHKGIIFKTIFLLLMVATTSVLVYAFLPDMLNNEKTMGAFYGLLFASAIIALICGIAGRFETRATKYLTVTYALAEGLLVGFITRLVDYFVPGAGLIAISATLVIFGVVFILYSFGVLRATSRLAGIMIAIMISALALSITSMIAYFLATDHTYFLISIGVEALFLIWGVISLVFCFAEADAVVARGCSKNAEWCVSLGFCIEIVFIYIEILRLILYITAASRD